MSYALPILALVTVTWLASALRRDASLVDRVWGLGFVVVAWWVAAAAQRRGAPVDWLLVTLVSAWGLRLSWHITVRNWGHGEDRRYAAMRARNGPSWWWQNYVTVFLLQGALMVVIALPLVMAIPAPDQRPVRWLAALVWAAGFGFEAIGDWQLARFRADPANRGRVMDRGLWRYTRHPNYFGEALLWWGVWGFALAAGAWWTVVSPIAVTLLLLRVSGVPLLEADLARRRPGYAEYVRRTSGFVPRRPRTGDG